MVSVHRPRGGIRRPLRLTVGFALALAACLDDKQTQQLAQSFQSTGNHPDQPPVMLNRELPFRYPAALYARRVQGNVTLRLFIDGGGRVHPESTRVEESSGFGSLDTAAVRGARELRFAPAKLHGDSMAVTILFPVYFRYPGAAPLPGDTILKMRPSAGRTR